MTLVIRTLCCLVLGSAVLWAADTTTTRKAKPVTREIAVVETSLGTFEFELLRADAPKTVENFTGLAAKNFFDGMRVHRIAKGFVIQTGDEKSKDPARIREWGTGGQSIWGTTYADELNPAAPSYQKGYQRGTVAMANRGPNTNTSQFFVMLNAAPWLPKNYTIFGSVTKGMEVVDAIAAVEIVPPGAGDGRPKSDVMVKTITVRTETAKGDAPKGDAPGGDSTRSKTGKSGK